MWFGAYDACTPFVMQNKLDATQELVRPFRLPHSLFFLDVRTSLAM
jgi:hypothetical protein